MRENYGTSGKTPFTDYLYSLGAQMADDDASDGMGSGIARYGKHLIEWDDAGFVTHDRYPSVQVACMAFTLNAWRYLSDDDDESATEPIEPLSCAIHEGRYHAMGGFVCELYSQENMYGTT